MRLSTLQKLILGTVFFLLALSGSLDAQIKPEDVATRDQFEEITGQFVDQLDNAEEEAAIMELLVQIVELKCYFPLENYEDLYEAVRQKKINAPTPDVRFAAATVSKFLKAEVSPAQGKAYLSIEDRAAMFERIAENLY